MVACLINGIKLSLYKECDCPYVIAIIRPASFRYSEAVVVLFLYTKIFPIFKYNNPNKGCRSP